MIQTDERFEIRFVDATRLATFARCEARFLFRSLMGLIAQDEDRTKLDYGSIMHRVLPLMYQGSSSQAIEMFDKLWLEFGMTEVDDRRTPPLSYSRIVDFVSTHNSTNRIYDIVHYPFSLQTKLISENEIPFLIDIGLIYPLAGRIDAAIRLRSNDRLFAYDFKTASEISPRYFEGFWFSPQALSYTVALRQISGEVIDGLAVEAMRISKKNIENQMGFAYVTEIEARKFIAETGELCGRIAKCNKTGVWRQSYALCASYPSFGFPCGVCEYKLLCMANEWEELARFYRREKPFDPLETKERG